MPCDLRLQRPAHGPKFARISECLLISLPDGGFFRRVEDATPYNRNSPQVNITSVGHITHEVNITHKVHITASNGLHTPAVITCAVGDYIHGCAVICSLPRAVEQIRPLDTNNRGLRLFVSTFRPAKLITCASTHNSKLITLPCKLGTEELFCKRKTQNLLRPHFAR